MRILLIEDDEAVATVEKGLLNAHELVHVTNLHDATQARMNLHYKTGGAEFDVVILDLKLPIVRKPNEYHDPEEVIEFARRTFPQSIVIVVSGYLDLDLIALADEHQMISIDKSLIVEAKTFVETFNKAVEVSKMRSTLLAHMTTGAVETAAAECPHPETSPMDRTRANLYLAAGLTVVLIPWVLLLYTMWAKAVLRDPQPIPYYSETLMFCGLCLSAILGVTPWILQFFGKGNGGTNGTNNNK